MIEGIEYHILIAEFTIVELIDRNLNMTIKMITKFLHLEAASGIVLFFFAVLAVVLDNSPFAAIYQHILNVPFSFNGEEGVLAKPLLFWVNEGLMSIFFLLVSLELKREFLEGELAGTNKIILPGIAACGGMIVPALIYLAITWQHGVAVKGWAVPVATDIAFALGVLSLFGKRVPVGLKLFLMALAIFDDVGAIIIIAFVYSHHLSYVYLTAAFLIIAGLCFLNKLKVQCLASYLLLGFLLWICILSSGVHATVAGVILGLIIPLKGKNENDVSPLSYLEDKLHPWVAFFVMPLFAFANSGVSFQGLTWHILLDPVAFGVIAGLVIGKQLGVFSFAWFIIRMGWAAYPEGANRLAVYGVALLCGIGFTMSLFLGTLAFQDEIPKYLIEVRLGVLLGSIISGVIGAMILHIAFAKQTRAY